MYERFTDRARKVMQLANQEAQRLNHDYLGTEHVLLGLLKEGTGGAAESLKKHGLDLADSRREVGKVVSERGPQRAVPGTLPKTPRLKAALVAAAFEADRLGSEAVGTEHILLGLLTDSDCVAVQILLDRGVELDRLREDTRRRASSSPAREAEVERRVQVLRELASGLGSAREPGTDAKAVSSFIGLFLFGFVAMVVLWLASMDWIGQVQFRDKSVAMVAAIALIVYIVSPKQR